MNEIQFIKTEALDLPVDMSKTVHCCFCDNEKPYPPSLSLTRIDDGILYNCFRASCSGQGLIGSLPTDFQVTKGVQKDNFKARPYVMPLYELSQTDKEYLYDRYKLGLVEIDRNSIKSMRGSSSNDFIFPLYDHTGSFYGHTTKRNDAKLKAIHYLERKTSNLYWPYSVRRSPWDRKTVIIVEDVLSAIRVNRFKQGVALLGTSMTKEKVKDLLLAGVENVILALDPDAFVTAQLMQEKWGLFFNTFRVVLLTDDPKDLKHTTLEAMLV